MSITGWTNTQNHHPRVNYGLDKHTENHHPRVNYGLDKHTESSSSCQLRVGQTHRIIILVSITGWTNTQNHHPRVNYGLDKHTESSSSCQSRLTGWTNTQNHHPHVNHGLDKHTESSSSCQSRVGQTHTESSSSCQLRVGQTHRIIILMSITGCTNTQNHHPRVNYGLDKHTENRHPCVNYGLDSCFQQHKVDHQPFSDTVIYKSSWEYGACPQFFLINWKW